MRHFPSDCVIASPAPDDTGQLAAGHRLDATAALPLKRRVQNFPISAAGTSSEEFQRRLDVDDAVGPNDVNSVDNLWTASVGVGVGVVADGHFPGKLVDSEHAEKFTGFGAVSNQPHEHRQQRPAAATTTAAATGCSG